MSALLALIAGLLIRLAIPIALTALLIFLLRKLDARWQAEAQWPQPVMQDIECWKLKNCTAEQRKNCVCLSSNAALLAIETPAQRIFA